MPFISSALGRFVYLGSTIPLKVYGLTFSNITNTGFQVSWSGGSGATSYVYTINGTTTTPSNDQGVASKYAVFSGLSPLVNYTINILPKNPSGSVNTAFTAASVPGIKLWLDASDPYNNNGSSRPANNSTNINWSDKSGNGYTAYPNSNSGGYSTFNTNILNGLPAIYMNNGGTGYSSYYCNGIPTGTFNSEFDIFIVYNYIPTEYSRSIAFNPTLFAKSQSNGYAPNAYLILEGGKYYNIVGQQNGSSGTTGPYFSSVTPSILNMNLSQASQATSQLTGFINGAQFIMNGTTSGWSPFTDNGSNIQIGSRVDGAGQAELYVYEVIIYNVKVSVANRQKIEGYLAWKWGLNKLLSPIHPYYLYTPQSIITTTSINPFSLVFSNVTSTSFQVNWSGGATASSYKYMLNGIKTTPAIDMGALSKYAIFTGLYEASVYSVVVIANNTGAAGLNTAVPPDPSSITGLKMWFDASDPLATGTSPPTGTNISTWYDKSSNGYSTIASTNNILLQNDGLPYLDFYNGGLCTYTTPAMSWMVNSYYTLFIVESLTKTTNDACIMSRPSGGAGPIKYGAIGSSAIIYFGLSETQGRGLSVGFSPYTTNVTRLWSFSFTSTSSAYTQTIYLNGTSIGSNTSTGYVQNGDYVIGGYGTPSDEYGSYIGKMREMIAYQTDMGTTDRQKVEGYMAQKWGLTLSLPSNHPYYNVSMDYPSATPFSPLSPSSASMKIWYDASDPQNDGPGNQPTLGTTLTTWYDKSSNSYNATGVSNVIYRRDGRFYIDCSGGYFTMPTGSMNWVLNTYFTLFIVETMSYFVNDSTGNTLFGATSGGNNQFFNVSLVQSTQTGNFPSLYVYYKSGNNFNSNKAISMGNTRIWTLSLIYSVNRTVTSIYLNGNFLTNNSCDQLSAFVGPTIAAGNNNYTGNHTYIGRYRELIGYQGTLSRTDQQQIEGYLAQKWSTQNILPPSHQYYSNQASPIVITSTFSPNYVQGLKNWYDASDPLNTRSPPATGTTITTWYDKSGNLNHATGGSIVIRNDGYYYLDAPGTGSYTPVNIPNPSSFYSTYFSMFMVETVNIPGGYGSTIFDNGNHGGGGFMISYNGSGQMLFLIATSSGSSLQIKYPPDGVYPVLSSGVTRLWGFMFSQTQLGTYTMEMSLNGIIVSRGSGPGFLTNNMPTGLGLSPYVNLTYNGKMREFLFYTGPNGMDVYNGNLNKSDRQNIEGYLAWKWGLQKLLPVSHPYYSAPPTGVKNVANFATTNLALETNNFDSGTNPVSSILTNGTTTYTIVGGKACAFFNKGNTLSYAITWSWPNIVAGYTYAYWFYAIDNGQYTPWTISNGSNGTGSYGINANFSTDVSGIQHFYLNASNQNVDAGGQGFIYPIQSGTWYFVTLVLNIAINSAQSYMNGRYMSQTSMGGGTGMNNMDWLNLGTGASGGMNGDTTQRTFYGYIRNFMIFNYDLSLADINNLYNQTNTFLGPTSASSYLPLTTNSTDIGISPQNVTLNGSITYTNIANKACAYFNSSSNNYLSLPFTSSKVFTISYWFYAADYNYYNLWSLSSTATGTAYGVSADIQTGAQNFSIIYSGGSVNVGNYSYPNSSGSWYFVTLVVNDRACKSYVNGGLVNSVLGSGTLSNRNYLLIGKGMNGGGFNGYLKDFMFYNSELTPSDISTLYNMMNIPTVTTINLISEPSQSIIITSVENIYKNADSIITKQFIELGTQTIIFNNNSSGSGLISGFSDYSRIQYIWPTAGETSLHISLVGNSSTYYVCLPASGTAPGGFSVSSALIINTGSQFGSGAGFIEFLVGISDTKAYGILSTYKSIILILNGVATYITLTGGSISDARGMAYGGTTSLGQDILYISNGGGNIIQQVIVTSSTSGVLTTIVGGGTSLPSPTNTYGTSVQLVFPRIIAYYSPLNILFFCDNNPGGNTSNSIIRMYIPGTSTGGVGQVTTLQGIAPSIQYIGVDNNLGVLYASAGLTMYRYIISSIQTDRGYIPIFVITNYLSVVTISTSGVSPWTSIGNSYTSLAVDSSNNIYIGRDGNYVYIINSSGVVSQFAFQTYTGQRFWGVVYANNYLYIGDVSNGVIKVNSSGNIVATYAVGVSSCFTDGNGNVYAVNGSNGVVSKIDSNGNITTAVSSTILSTLNGGSGPGQSPYGTIDSSGNIYLADQSYRKIIKVTNGVASYMTPTFTNIVFGQMGIDSYGNLFIVCNNSNTSTYQIQFINKVNGDSVYTYTDTYAITGAVVDSAGTIWFVSNNNTLKKLPTR